MALTTPTTKDVSDNIVAQIETTTSQTVPLLPKSFIRVLSRALAGVYMILYKYAGWSFLQQFVATASSETVTVNGVTLSPLIEWGRLVGVGDPIAATQAELTVTITVKQQTGTLPINSQLVGATNGVTYITLAAVTLDADTKTVNVRAASDQTGNSGAGIIGNLEVGDSLSFSSPLPNVSRDATVSAIVTTAADAETTEAYRQRVISRFSARPQGGAPSDYDAWGGAVTNVANIYPYTDALPGRVNVYIESTTSYDADGLADAPLIANVEAAIEQDVSGLASRRQLGALVTGVSITRSSFEVTVNGLTTPNSLSALQTSITDALSAYFLDREPYIAGLTPGVPEKDLISQYDLISVIQPIVTGDSGTFTSLSFNKVAASTVTSYALGEGEKAKMSTISFI